MEKEEVFNRILSAEQKFKAVADRNRIKVLTLLSKGEMCVCQLVAVTDAPQSTVSNTLNQLERANLIRRREKGKLHYYSLTENSINHLLLEMIFNKQ